MPSMQFRAGVVAVVTDARGQVMAFERSDVPGAWQLPQGGIDVGEATEDAAWRELQEETGLGPDDVDLIGEYPEWTIYEWPVGVRDDGVRRHSRNRLGQAQRWFVFRVRHGLVEPIPDGVEFQAWRWVDPRWLIDQVVEFRRPAYERVLSRLDDEVLARLESGTGDGA
jgi:putative (di)nucleoside polyphosphate hydrolase